MTEKDKEFLEYLQFMRLSDKIIEPTPYTNTKVSYCIERKLTMNKSGCSMCIELSKELIDKFINILLNEGTIKQ